MFCNVFSEVSTAAAQHPQRARKTARFCAGNARNKTGTSVTKLLYMGIIADWRGGRAWRAYRVGGKDGPPMTGRSLQSFSVESGDGGKREQGDPGRKSRQGSGDPADPGWPADRQP